MKFVFYRSAVQIPLIIRPPDGMKGKVIEQDVELIDIPATLLEILNISLPSEHRGKSLLPFIIDKKSTEDYQHKNLIISQVGNYAMGVTKDWKFVVNSSSGKLLELYDRKKDYYENNNLVRTEEGKKIGEDLYKTYLEEIIPKVKTKKGINLI